MASPRAEIGQPLAKAAGPLPDPTEAARADLLLRLREAREQFETEQKNGSDGRNCACAQFIAMIEYVRASVPDAEQGLLAPASLLLIDLANFNIGRGTGPMLALPETRGRGRSVAPLSDTLLKQYVAGAVWVFMDAGEREEVARTHVQRKIQSYGWKKGIATIKAWRGEVTSLAPSKKRAYLTIQRLWLEEAKGREPANSFVNRLLNARVQPLIERTGQGWRKGGEI